MTQNTYVGHDIDSIADFGLSFMTLNLKSRTKHFVKLHSILDLDRKTPALFTFQLKILLQISIIFHSTMSLDLTVSGYLLLTATFVVSLVYYALLHALTPKCGKMGLHVMLVFLLIIVLPSEVGMGSI